MAIKPHDWRGQEIFAQQPVDSHAFVVQPLFRSADFLANLYSLYDGTFIVAPIPKQLQFFPFYFSMRNDRGRKIRWQ
jgi:hypothetical protein